MDRAYLERCLAEGQSLAAIAARVGLPESTVGYWVKKHGLRAAKREKHAAGGGLARPQLQALVARGMTIAEIASEVRRSKSTVRYWLTRHGLGTQGGRGRRVSVQARAAREAGFVTALMHCERHGETQHRVDARGYYRCTRCSSDAVARRRRKVKTILVVEAGGCCCICGYRRNMRALHFHHVEPSQKRHTINAKGVAVALEKLRAEAQKCVLLCSNCHAEVEDGMAWIPADALG